MGFLGLSAPTNLAPAAEGEDELPRAPEESFSFAGGEMYFLPPSRQAPVAAAGGGARSDEPAVQGAAQVRGAIERRASAVAAALGWKTRDTGGDAAAKPGGGAEGGGDDGGDDGGVPRTLPIWQEPDPSRTGTKYPVQESLTSIFKKS